MLMTGDVVSLWVATKLGITIDLDKTAGVGWTDVEGHLLMGAAFYNYSGQNMYIHVYCCPGHRLVPTFVAAMMDYPFNQARVQRLTGLIPAKSECGKALAIRLGGVLEGTLRECLAEDDLLVYGLLKRDAARWLTAAYQRRLRPIGEAYGKVIA